MNDRRQLRDLENDLARVTAADHAAIYGSTARDFALWSEREDAEDRAEAAIEALAQIPPADLTAFPLDGIHGYQNLARRVCWTLILTGGVVLFGLIVLWAWKPNP